MERQIDIRIVADIPDEDWTPEKVLSFVQEHLEMVEIAVYNRKAKGKLFLVSEGTGEGAGEDTAV